MPLVYPHKVINLDDAGDTVRLDRHYQWVDIVGTPDADFDLWLPPAEIPGAPLTVNAHPEDGSGRIRIRPQTGKTLEGGDFLRWPALGPSSLHSHAARVTLIPNISPTTGKPNGNWHFIGGELVQWGIVNTGTVTVVPTTISDLAPFDDTAELHEAYTGQWDITNAQWTPPEAGTYSFFIVFNVVGLLAGEAFWGAITAPGGIYYMANFHGIPAVTSNFILGAQLTLPLTTYGIACYHDGAGNRSVQAEVQIHRVA